MYNNVVDYRFLSKTNEECFIELTENTFRTRIAFNFKPDDDFIGIAVCCNYHFKGHPIGHIKDNGLILRQIDGYKKRACFAIGETAIQAGPALIEEGKCKKNKEYFKEGFATHHILKGLHVHIGQKKSGNTDIGFSNNLTFGEIIKKYENLNTIEAIKLPGLKRGAFLFQSKVQKISQGLETIPVALIFEPRLEKVGNLFSEIV